MKDSTTGLGLDPHNPDPADHANRGGVYDPATRHGYITMLHGENIGDPRVKNERGLPMFRPGQVDMRDLMAGIAKQCRYYGQVNGFYSVAEHSVLVSRMAELDGHGEEVILAGLFHDAHEYVITDIASPQKDMIGPNMRAFEAEMEAVVRKALGLDHLGNEVWKIIRRYDILILHRELARLRSHRLPDWYDPNMERLVHPRIQPVGFEWREAQAVFRARMHDLGWGLGGTV